MPPELRKAHQENDKAVMEAYGFDWHKMTVSDCVAELMKMYENKIVQNNIEKLKQYGYKIIEPSIGSLACGYEAKGHLPKKEEIIEYVKILVKEKK